MENANLDLRTVTHFGEEWTRFPQSGAGQQAELSALFAQYFAIFPWSRLSPDAVGFDFGCGTGRWARWVAPRVGRLHCVDASAAALAVARTNLRDFANCRFAQSIPMPHSTADFGYCLGVLHHIPDAPRALRECVRRLKPGAPFLVYVYYDLANRPAWYRRLWQLTIMPRKIISRLPRVPRVLACDVIAALVYLPLARLAQWLEHLTEVSQMPLAYYRNSSFYTMRTDALDRFGTPLEQRFSRGEVEKLLQYAGLECIQFSSTAPFWVVLGYRGAETLEAEHV